MNIGHESGGDLASFLVGWGCKQPVRPPWWRRVLQWWRRVLQWRRSKFNGPDQLEWPSE